jgi:hypothetical protein
MWNIIRFVGYTLGGYAIRSAYNWLTADLDPTPGTKEFAIEYRKTYAKYQRLRRLHEAYRKDR